MTFDALIRAGSLEIGDGYRAKNSELGGDGPVFLRAGLVSDAEIDLHGAERFHAELTHRLRGKMSRRGDTIVTTKGNSTGRTAYIGFDSPAVVYSPHLSYWRSLNEDTINPQFLRHWARGEEFREQLEGMSHSTDMAPYLSLADQRRLTISLPDVAEQVQVGNLLGALDDKIDLNRRMNRTLEETASALFRSWFVDFDPAVTKAAGRAPFGMDAATAALFPSSFEDSDLGPIPRGWQVGDIYRAACVVYGAPFASQLFNSGHVGRPLVRIRDLADHDPAVWTQEDHPKGTIVRAGDIVVGMDGEFRAHVWRGPESWLNQRVCKFNALEPYGRAFVYFAIKEPLAGVERSEVGTTVIHLGKYDIDRFRVPFASERIHRIFQSAVDPLLELTVRNGIESRTLAALRAMLLPKLLSGEIRLRDAEHAVESVA